MNTKNIIVDVTPAREISRYPYIGRARTDGLIVMFCDVSSGFVLSDATTSRIYGIGSYSDCWIESDFEKFYGTITITCK